MSSFCTLGRSKIAVTYDGLIRLLQLFVVMKILTVCPSGDSLYFTLKKQEVDEGQDKVVTKRWRTMICLSSVVEAC